MQEVHSRDHKEEDSTGMIIPIHAIIQTFAYSAARTCADQGETCCRLLAAAAVATTRNTCWWAGDGAARPARRARRRLRLRLREARCGSASRAAAEH